MAFIDTIPLKRGLFPIASFYCCWNQLYNWTYKTLKSITFSINFVFCIDYLIFHGTINSIPSQHCYSSAINDMYVQNGYPEAHDISLRQLTGANSLFRSSKFEQFLGGFHFAHLFDFLCCVFCSVGLRSVFCGQCWRYP